MFSFPIYCSLGSLSTLFSQIDIKHIKISQVIPIGPYIFPTKEMGQMLDNNY